MQVLWAVNMSKRCPGGRPTSVASIAHVPELEAVFVAMHTGELSLIHTDTQDIEEVPTCRAQHAEWSPERFIGY